MDHLTPETDNVVGEHEYNFLFSALDFEDSCSTDSNFEDINIELDNNLGPPTSDYSTTDACRRLV